MGRILCGAGQERRLREGKAAGAGSVSLDLRSHDPLPAGPRPHPSQGSTNSPRILLLLAALGKGPPRLQRLWSWFRGTQTSAACVGVSG